MAEGDLVFDERLEILGYYSGKPTRRLSDNEISDRCKVRFKRLWRGAIAAAILALIRKVDVDTGMSVGSLEPLALQIRTKKLVASFAGSGTRPGHKNAGRFGFPDNDGTPKSRAFGVSLGEKAYEVNFEPPELQWKFAIPVLQWALYELGFTYNDRRVSGHHSLDDGRIAFEKFIDDNFDHFLNPAEILSWAMGGASDHG